MNSDQHSTSDIKTLDDLLRFIYQLHETLAAETDRSLEQYLRALWRGIQELDQDQITHATIANLFLNAFTEEPDPFNQGWFMYSSPANLSEELGVFELLKRLLLNQITDLRLMANADMLNPQQRFGFDSPTGHRWNNVHPATFLECGVAGIRDHILLYLNGQETPIGRDPHSTSCSWKTLSETLWFGQNYE